MTVTRIVVGIEGSEHAALALRWAAREAVIHDASVTAVLAWSFLDQHHPPDHEGFDPSYGEEAAHAALRCYLAQSAGDQGPEAIQARAICDLPARALMEAAADADLLVVGARGLGGFKGLLLGSVSQHCILYAQIPVAVVRDEPTGAEGVLCAVEDSPGAVAALEWAANEARKRSTPLHIVHTWRARRLHRTRPGEQADVGAEQVARQFLEAMVEAADLGDIDVRPRAVHGTPKSVASEVAATAQLIVIGASAHHGLKGRLSSSAAIQVAQSAQCPVVIIPPTDQGAMSIKDESESAMRHTPFIPDQARSGTA